MLLGVSVISLLLVLTFEEAYKFPTKPRLL